MTTNPTALEPLKRSSARTRRRTVFVATAVALALAAALAWWLLIRDSGPTPGPLSNSEAASITVKRHVGQPFGFGMAVAVNHGDQPAVLRSIRLVNPTPGLRVIDTRVSGPEREMLSLSTSSEWPSDDFTDQRPVAGFHVAPVDEYDGERGVELLFGLQADRVGRYDARAVAVEYTVGDTEHLAYIRQGIRVCVIPASERIGGGDCPALTGLNGPIVED